LSEARLKQKMATLLKERGLFFRRFAGSAFTRAGVPDFFVLLPDGRACWIEVKAPGRYKDVWAGCRKDSPAQWLFLTAVNAGGGLGLCVDSLEAVIAALG
jgi:hypothetical protein